MSRYLHHGAWWLYYREGGRVVRRKLADGLDSAERLAAQVNAQLTQGAPTLVGFAPTLVGFSPIDAAELVRRFLDWHSGTLGSPVATVNRYRAATTHLVNFVASSPRTLQAHEAQADQFAAYLRLKVAPNGHPDSARRKLQDKGIVFILETCRALYNFAAEQRCLPPYGENPFAVIPLHRLKIEDLKPILVFDENRERAFSTACDDAADRRSRRHPSQVVATLVRHVAAGRQNVDPLARQLTLGHRPTTDAGLGMTASYTRTRRETQREQGHAALGRCGGSLDLARGWERGPAPWIEGRLSIRRLERAERRRSTTSASPGGTSLGPI